MPPRAADGQETLTIVEAAKHVGMSAHTLRYYERAGLMRPIARTARGHRRYTTDDLTRLRFLHMLRQTGMPIRLVRRFATGAGDAAATRALRIELLRTHRARLSATIEELTASAALVDGKLRQLHSARAHGAPRRITTIP